VSLVQHVLLQLFHADHNNENVNANGDTHIKGEPKDASNVDQNSNEGKSIHC